MGEHFKGEPSPRNNERIERFALIGPNGEHPLAGKTGDDPAGVITATQPGWHVAAYRGTRASIELPAEKFEAYLKEEGLEAIIAERATRGESNKPGREWYSRCAKSFICVGGVTSPTKLLTKPVGLTLELVAEEPLTTLASGESLAVRLLLHGKPLAGALVVAVPRADPAGSQSARTCMAGVARFKIDHSGDWLIKCVNMMRVRDAAEADWESLWTSLTFTAGATRPAR